MAAPAVFTTAPFEEATSRAAHDDRLVLIDFSADWCLPCKQMDETTWLDASVAAWVRENAVAIRVDVDAQEALAQQFNVQAMPTMVLMRGGRTLDRVAGARPATALLSWLESAVTGATELGAVEAALKPGDVNGRFQLARAFLDASRLDEAHAHLEELWLHALEHEPAWADVRRTFLMTVIAQLVDARPASRERFEALRDALESRLDDTASARDWLALNRALRDDERSLSWLEGLRGAPPVWLEFEDHLRELLVEREWWAQLGALTREPLAHLRRDHGVLQHLRESTEERADLAETIEFFAARLRDTARVLIRALRAAGREAEVDAVRAEARRLDDSTAMHDATA